MEDIINQLKLKLNNERFVVAVSTGVDSMTLLDLCLKAGLGANLIIAHVNHGLRKESNDEECFILSFAAQKGLKFESINLNLINTDSNMELTARTLRYQFFADVLDKYHAKYLLLAHNADDNLETMIMRFLKSSSIEGYAGIKEETKVKGYIYYRPLLHISKDEIYEYAVNNNLTYFEDHTNKEDEHLRNRIRHHVVPYLKEENPNLYAAVNYYNEQLLGVSELLNNTFDEFKKHHVNIISNEKQLITYFKMEELNKLGQYLRRQVLFNILKPYVPSINIVNQVLEIIDSPKNKIKSKINDNLMVIKEYGLIYFDNQYDEHYQYYFKITTPGTYELPHNLTLIVNKNNCYLHGKGLEICYNDTRLPITIRTRNNGDKMVRNSKKGVYKQSVSDILTNLKIPTIKRNYLLLLCVEDQVKYILEYKIK